MQCLKCGQDTKDSRVFCDSCLAEMEKRPIKSGTPVTIYKRNAKPVSISTRKQVKNDELLLKLKRKNNRLIVWVVVLAVLLASCVGVLAWKFYEDFGKFPIGQNYNTETQMTLGPADK